MTNASTITSAILAATDLDQLFAAIESYQDDDARIDEVADLCGLPVYGGDEPVSTIGIWSWDADRMICSDYNGNFVIESRADYNFPGQH
jgi:hypothetical protein